MSSTNKTSLGLNMWEASDKPVRQDFVNDNVIIDEKITKLNSDLALKVNLSDLAYFTRIRYGVKWFSDSGNKSWINISLADLGFPNSTLTDYPCIMALPQINPSDSANTNADVQVLCAKMTTDKKSMTLLLNRVFSSGLTFAVWFVV
jgi:hypothetical protein